MDYKKLIENIKNFEEYKLTKNRIFSESGPIFELQNEIKKANKEQRAELGKQLSKLRNEIDHLLEIKLNKIKEDSIKEKIEKDTNDIYVHTEDMINYHPLFLISQRFRQWFLQNGYFEE
ncbi:MAG: phenylalanine--tRNA ligase subunit alpha, partial [Mycoplasmataceae bacterium]|nr:phenylalanine--tRNA ligase subunit alpha [Mycoplasmataceae bacterium]